MKKLSAVLSLIALTLGLCSAVFAATEYVVANDNNFYHSNLIVYTFDTATGSLTRIAELPTGGANWGAAFSHDFANQQQAISTSGTCIFAIDGRSNDIAAFSKTLSYAVVGNYSNESLTVGASLTLSPNAKFLYASYTGNNNLGAWSVNQDCSLSFIAAYGIPNGEVPGPIKATPNGSYLVASLRNGAELFALDKSSGAMTDKGFLDFSSVSKCSGDNPCVADGLDFTRDSKVVIFAASFFGSGKGGPIALLANVSSSGLTGLRGWSLANRAGVGQSSEENYVPSLSAAGYAGSGNLYFGLADGVITATFTESPAKISVLNATAIQFPGLSGASIATTGNMLIQSQYPNELATFSINADGSLAQLSTSVLTNPLDGMFSFSIFPNTRQPRSARR